MKINTNHEAFTAFQKQVGEQLNNHELLTDMVGTELATTAEEIICTYFEKTLDMELNDLHFDKIAESVELTSTEAYNLESDDGKIFTKDIASYVLKELAYRELVHFIKTQQMKVITAAG